MLIRYMCRSQPRDQAQSSWGPSPICCHGLMDLRNHRIELWVVSLLNQSTCQEMHPGVFASFTMISLKLAAAASRAPSTMPGRQVAQSSARSQAALIQHQAMPGVNLAQASAGFTMPHSSETLFSSQQLLTLQKEYQPGIKPAWCCTGSSLLWPCYIVKPDTHLALGSEMMKMSAKGAVLPLLVGKHHPHRNGDRRKASFACMWRPQVCSHGLGAS